MTVRVLVVFVLLVAAFAAPAAGTHATPCTTPAGVAQTPAGYVITVVEPARVLQGTYLESNGEGGLQRGGHGILLGEDCYDGPNPDTLVELVEVVGGGSDPAYFAGVIRILSLDGAPPTATHDPGLDCDPLAWDGTTASIDCVPAAPQPPGFEWRCLALQVGVLVVGSGSVEGVVGCNGGIGAFCTATASGSPPYGACYDSTGFVDNGPAPLRCRGVVNSAAQTTTWSVVCGSPDP